MGLKEYKQKRDFKKTAEPAGKEHKGKPGALSFVVQKHAASRLHYDFRLELEGVLKSWAVPKGPSYDTKDKRLAVQVEDHPLEYGTFEGIIPQGEYGGGTVMLWDRGTWKPKGKDPLKDLRDGMLKFTLDGERLQGDWVLVRLRRGEDGGKDNWLLIKEKDETAGKKLAKGIDTTSVSTGRSMEEIAGGKSGKPAKGEKGAKKKAGGGLNVWHSGGNRSGENAADASGVDGARKAAMPDALTPQLATLVKSAPPGKHWVHEIKFDGYRILAFCRDGKVELISRTGKAWTSKFIAIADELESLPVESAILDGELVAVDAEGHSSFQGLQNALSGDGKLSLAYYVFDLPYLNGYDLKKCTLAQRKELLQTVVAGLPKGTRVLYSEHFTDPGNEVWERACSMELEGIISKDINAPYETRRSKSWVKVKCSLRQEFIIVGYTDPEGAREGLGALLLGIRDKPEGPIRYCGKVGTGFNRETLKSLYKTLSALEQDKARVEGVPRAAWVRRGAHWVEPKLVCEVAFAEWTSDGQLRHPSFQGLREDKSASETIVETAEPPPEKPKSKASSTKSAAKKAPAKASSKGKAAKMSKVGGAVEPIETDAEEGEFRLTSPDRVIFPEAGFTKRDMAEYYKAVAEVALPYMVNRPLTLLRCPAGRGKPCFYQRHTAKDQFAGVEPVPIKVKGGTEDYLSLKSFEGLMSLVQFSALELHGWQCSTDDLDHPDTIVFDVDPDEGIDWSRVILAAKRIKTLLENVGLVPFIKTTGGKGLHVVVPLKPKAGWDEVKGFAEAVAHALAEQYPDDYVANMRKDKRKGKLYIDYLRNGLTASAVLPYSTRAREGGTVATPIRWDEVKNSLDPKKFTIGTVPERLARMKRDPWADYEKSRRVLDLGKLMDTLSRK